MNTHPPACPVLRLKRPYVLLLLLGLLVACGSVSDVQAQPAAVRGFVTDQSSGQALEGVNVILESLDDENARLRGSVSDPDGIYTLSGLPPGRYQLRASFVGFQTYVDTLQLAADEVHSLNIALMPTETALGEVVVEAERTSSVGQVTAGYQAIEAGDIELIPTPGVSGDLASYLTTLPGVVTMGDRGGQLFVRGGEPSHNLVLLDGMPIYQPFHVLGFYSAFPSDIISQVDFYAGGYGSQYSGRISSVLNIHTRNGNKKSFAGSASISPFVGAVLLEGPIIEDRLSFIGSFRRSLVQEIAALYINAPLPYNFYDAFGKLHLALGENNRISFRYLRTYDRSSLGDINNDDLLDEIRWNSTAYGVRWLLLSQAAPIIGELIFSISDLRSELGPREDPIRTSTIGGFKAAVNLTYLAGRSEVNWGAFLRSNAPSSRLGGLYQNVVSDKRSLPALGVYLEPDIYVGYGLRIRPGVVGQMFNREGIFLEPRFRMVWELGPHQISGAAGLYHQEVVGLHDRRDATNVFTAWTAPPDGIMPQAFHGLLGYQVDLTSWLHVSAEGFYKDISNLLIAEWTASPRFTTQMQRASGRAIGVDLRIELRRPSFYGFITYGLSSVRYKAQQASLKYWFGQTELAFRPPHDRRHQVNLVANTSLGEFDVSLRWSFGSGLPYSRALGFDQFLLMDGPVDVFEAPDEPRVIYADPFNGNLPAYHRLDISVKRTFAFDHADVTLQANVINLYNRNNIFSLDVFTLERTNQLPVIPTLGLQVAFN